MRSPVILTVLRESEEYNRDRVNRLARQCDRYAPGVPFLCLDHTTLMHDWPTWWCKIECFLIKGPVLFMDLDTHIVGSLAPLLEVVQHHPFVALRDFNAKRNEMGSGLMSWNGDVSKVYHEFLRDPEGNMMACTTRERWGDQGFIDKVMPDRVYWQDIVPGAVVSWKKHCRGGIPPEARVVCFHGKPKPWDIGL